MGDVAGLDTNSGGYPFPTDNINLFKFWSNEKDLLKWIDTCNYGKNISDNLFLSPRVFNWNLTSE